MKPIYLLLGAPGSGKTSTMRAVKSDRISHFSIGEMYRQIANEATELGTIVKHHIERGKVVPIDIARKVVLGFIESGKEIVVIDAFPRNMEQTKMLESLLDEQIVLSGVIEIMVNPEIGLERIVKRNRGVDDDAQLFNNRMEVYNEEIEAIRDYYLAKGIFITINGENSVEETAQKIASIIL